MVMYTLLVFDAHRAAIRYKFPLDSNIYRLFLALWILTRAEPTFL